MLTKLEAPRNYKRLINKDKERKDVIQIVDDEGFLREVSFDELTSHPTTLSGYGITDAVSAITSVNNDIVRFDGTAGQIQTSGVTIDDNGDIISGHSIYLTNIAGSVHTAGYSKLFFGPKSSPYNYIGANNSGVFGIYNSAQKGVSCYPDTNFFSTHNIDLGRSQSPWKNLYMNGKIYGPSYNYTLPTSTGTIALVEDLSSTISGLNLGTASQKDYTTSIAEGDVGLPTSDAVYNAISSAVTSALHYRGISTTAITDGGTETATINGVALTPQDGDIVIYSGSEYLWGNSVWNKLGDDSSYAYKTITISAGTGLTGGGNLTANRTISLSSETQTDIGKGVTAYGWGDHSLVGYALGTEIPTSVSQLTNDAGYLTTHQSLDGYATETWVQDQGYLTSFTETDPTVPSWAKAASKPSYSLNEISGTADLRLIEALSGSGLLRRTASNTWTLDTNEYLTEHQSLSGYATESYVTTAISNLNLGTASQKDATTTISSGNADLITSGSVYTALSGKQDTISDISTIRTNAANGATAYSWGDHSQAGYLTSFTETDPVFSASAAAGITSTDISNWNDAYSWGDHSEAGYLTSIPMSSNSVLGGVKVGQGSFLTIASSGHLSLDYEELERERGYLMSLPIASASVLGCIKVGDYLMIDSTTGVLSVDWQGLAEYIEDYLTLGTAAQKDYTSSVTSGSVNLVTSGAVYTALQSYALSSAIPTALSQLSDDATHKLVTDTQISTWNNKQDAISDLTTIRSNATHGETAYGWGDHSEAGYAMASDIPTVNNATLTIQQNGDTVNTFTANASTAVTANITVPTKTSDITNDSGFITSAALPTKTSDLTNDSGFITTSALSGYALSSEIHDATLTIKRNGTSVNTFTANASTNVIADISVPTKTSDITNDSGYITTAALSGYALSSDIPTALSDLSNDVGYITSSALTGYALSEDIPTDVSELTNDAGYITSSALSGYATESWVTARGYITSSALTGYATESWVEGQGYLTSYTETDPTVPSWAKASSKPSYTFSELTAHPTTISGYGITDAKISNGTITLGSNSIIPLTSYTETDPTVPSWAKASSKPSYTFSELTAHPTTLSGYGITDANISNGTITLGGNSITPLTSFTETDPTVPSWAKASSKPSYNFSEIGNTPTTLSGYGITDATPKTEAIPYIVGPSTDTTAGTWTGTYSGITAYVDGLTIIYVPAVAGASTTTLNINGLGAKTCYYTNSSKLTTHFAVGTPIMLTYKGGTWRRADYDSNTNTLIRVYRQTSGYNADYPIIVSRTQTIGTAGSDGSYTGVYGVVHDTTQQPTVNPSTGVLKAKTITATTLNGNLAWSYLTSTPTSLSGYGITDAVASSSITDSVVQDSTSIPTSGAVYTAISTAVTSALHYRGMSSVELTDGGTETAIISGQALIPQSGDIVIYGGFEFLWENSVWNKLGDDSTYAVKTINISGDGTYITGGGDLTASRTLTLSSSVITSLGKADTALQSSDLSGYVNAITQGTGDYVTSITKSGSTLTITRGTLPTTIAWSNVTDRPTALSEFTNDLVSSWATASTKPSYSLSEITGTDDLRVIEALGNTAGFLKKTGANAWSIDTNTYLTSSSHAALTLKVGSTTIGSDYNSLSAKTYTISASNITTAIGSTTYAPYNANGYLPLSGGTISGNLTVSGDTSVSDISISGAFSVNAGIETDLIPTHDTNQSQSLGEDTQNGWWNNLYVECINNSYFYGYEVNVSTMLSIPRSASTSFSSGKTYIYTSDTSAQSYDLSNFALSSDIPTALSELTNDEGYITSSALSGYATQTWVTGRGYITSASLPTDVSELNNDAGYITSSALSGYATQTWVENKGYLTSFTETDPTVPSWAKASTKPSYTFSEIGSKPTTLSGYGITDAKIETPSGTSNRKITLGSNNFTIYSWSLASAKPTYTLDDVSDGSTRKLADYLPLSAGSGSVLTGTLYSQNILPNGTTYTLGSSRNPWSEVRATTFYGNLAWSHITSKPTTISGYGITDASISNGTITLGSNSITPLTSYTETDPIFTAHAAHNVTSTKISNWDTAYNWGDHSTAGYLTSIPVATGTTVGGVMVESTNDSMLSLGTNGNLVVDGDAVGDYVIDNCLGAAATYGATTSVASGSSSLVTSGGVYTALQSYLPLSGGSMTGDIAPTEADTLNLGSSSLYYSSVFSKNIQLPYTATGGGIYIGNRKIIAPFTYVLANSSTARTFAIKIPKLTAAVEFKVTIYSPYKKILDTFTVGVLLFSPTASSYVALHPTYTHTGNVGRLAFARDANSSSCNYYMLVGSYAGSLLYQAGYIAIDEVCYYGGLNATNLAIVQSHTWTLTELTSESSFTLITEATDVTV